MGSLVLLIPTSFGLIVTHSQYDSTQGIQLSNPGAQDLAGAYASRRGQQQRSAFARLSPIAVFITRLSGVAMCFRFRLPCGAGDRGLWRQNNRCAIARHVADAYAASSVLIGPILLVGYWSCQRLRSGRLSNT